MSIRGRGRTPLVVVAGAGLNWLAAAAVPRTCMIGLAQAWLHFYMANLIVGTTRVNNIGAPCQLLLEDRLRRWTNF